MNMFCFPNSDNLMCPQEICLFSFHKLCIQQYSKESVFWGTIMWSEMGKQNIQAKKVFMYIIIMCRLK